MRPSVNWIKVTEKLPANDQNCIVWNGRYMAIGVAEIYDQEKRTLYREMADGHRISFAHNDEKTLKHWRECAGSFNINGMDAFFFDDPEVYWSPLPLAPGEVNPPPPNPFEGMIEKSIYLKKDGQIVGLHAIGEETEYQQVDQDGKETIKKGFFALEQWGNEYDENHNMLGRGSFRVFQDIEKEASDLEFDGWVRYEGPKKQEKP